MLSSVSEALLFRLRDFLTARMGLYYAEDRLLELERNFAGAATEFGFESITSCIDWLLSSPLTDSHVRAIAKHLTVGETYFFRDQPLFKYLQQELFPLMLFKQTRTKSLRIWSAGCCSGEEPYSLAMLLSGLVSNREDWKIDILATDINVNYLAKAFEAVYGNWSLRDTPEIMRDKFFIKGSGKNWAVKPHLRKAVNFSYANLADEMEHYPMILEAPMDIIFCRNVLIYFSETQARTTVQKLQNCLSDNGYLVLAPAEVGLASSGFNLLQAEGVLLLQKDSTATTVSMLSRAPAYKLPETFVAPNGGDQCFPSVRSHQPSKAPETKPALQKSKEVSDLDLFQQATELYSRRCYLQVIELLRPRRGRTSTAFHLPADTGALLARALANAGNMQEALEWIDRSLDQEKLNATDHFLRGSFLQQSARPEEAIKSFQNALFLDQSFIMAEFALANLFTQFKQPKKSKQHYHNCLRLMDALEQDYVVPESDGMIVANLKSTVLRLRDQGAKQPI